jgi:RHH-type proline utilization regulon transcriptional repressor/proline dehydrogenase/delta 1-pyrroline-5-carboxylate dehydrogenase
MSCVISDEFPFTADSSYCNPMSQPLTFDPALVDEAVALARVLQQRATELQTPQERRQQSELDRMLQNPADKATVVQLTDEAFRSTRLRRTAEHLTHILDVQGVPRFFSPLDRALLRGFRTFGGWLPGVSVPLVKEHMQQETANVILPAEPDLLAQHLRARETVGVRMNLNLLGETVLGEDEAAHRLEKCLEALQLPEVEVISIKISTLYSQISALAREHTIHILCDRLEPVFRTAAHLHFTRPDGTQVPKFVYLDMEEYRDLQLTAQSFMRTLERPGLEQVSGGIALQAYIPDSAAVQREINLWAQRRTAAGGAPVTIRIVKGANMEAERVDAALHGWPQAPFKTKIETDANYKRMLHQGIAALDSVRLGVASHNLFDLAYGLVLARRAHAADRIQFEMLEGMANHQRRALLEKTHNLLLYAPACRKEEFLNAIGYLLRRLDENTGPENFLRHAFKLSVDSPDWAQLESAFRRAFAIELSDTPRRTQNRLTETFDWPKSEMTCHNFENEPDTDWSLPQNSRWAETIVARQESPIREIPLVIAGHEIRGPFTAECLDPSQPDVVHARSAQATEQQIDQAVADATQDLSCWRSLSLDDRNAILGRVAQELRRSRADLMWAALANGGKILSESDPEVSEAIDFVEFYRAFARYYYELPGVRAAPLGSVVVIPPWNFPIAIPCGGIAAALAAGNTVLLKPASDTVLVAWVLCECFWRAGVPKSALQFLPCPGGTAGQRLATHSDIAAIILTGGTATALHLLRTKPGLRLFAETGGKNATVITALSDRELAIKHVLHSAFSHSGQKCSATSLLLLESEIYDDPNFQRMLCDAAKSLPVGSAWKLPTRMGPLIRPPSGDLDNALKTLEPGETWALRPEPIADDPHLWSPGIKYGVQPGSYTQNTEFFGPVLGVMRFRDLDEAIDLVNQTGYGLTSGLHSLDEREHTRWKNGILAGNLYINRGTTGAIVLRQPFGGMGKSNIGPGIKPGGPNYLAQFLHFEDLRAPASLPASVPRTLANKDLISLQTALQKKTTQGLLDLPHLFAALSSYEHWWSQEFSLEHDHFRLLGQDNFRRYLPFREIRVRVYRHDTAFDVFARACAARVTGARVLISHSADQPHPALSVLETVTESWAGNIEFIEETEAALADLIRQMPAHPHERIRFGAPALVPDLLHRAAAESGVYLADQPVLAHGRIELLFYVREQSISHDYHRYGNLGARANQPRQEPS